MTATTEQIPAGYSKRADGTLVPDAMIKPIDKLRDQTVEAIVSQAKALSEKLAAFKGQAFADIEAFIATSLDQYEVSIGGKKGNVTLVTFNGRYKVVRQIQEHLTFSEQLQAAKALIDECIMAWSENSRDEIKVLVNDAFRVDQEGKINTGRVLGLRRLAITSDRWELAMQAISDSVRVSGSKPYIRIYERINESDMYRPISLDIAAL